MVGAPDVVQPWMPRAARDKRGVPLARERRGWREAPRIRRRRRIGNFQQAPSHALAVAAAAVALAAGDGNEQPAHRTAPPPLATASGINAATRFAKTRSGTVSFAVATEDGRIRG